MVEALEVSATARTVRSAVGALDSPKREAVELALARNPDAALARIASEGAAAATGGRGSS